MRGSFTTIFQSMQTGLATSTMTAQSFYHRAHKLIAPLSTRNISIEEVVREFLCSLSQPNIHLITKHLSPTLSSKVRELYSSSEVKIQTFSRLLGGDLKDAISDEEVLLRYKQPFSRLGEEQYLVYVKLRLTSEDRYLAIWIKRNIHKQTQWRIEDLFVHDAYHKLSLGIQDERCDPYAYTLLGRSVDDSTSSALFFTRLLTEACPALPKAQLIDQSQRCNKEFITLMRTELRELLHTLHLCTFADDHPKIDQQLQHMVRYYRECATKEVTPNAEEAQVYHLLSLYRVPSDSKHITCILVHVFVPSISRYLTVWFSRSSLRGLTWNLDDFYIHKFGSLKPYVHADKKYCLKVLSTMKTRAFYTPDLIGEALLNPTLAL